MKKMLALMLMMLAMTAAGVAEQVGTVLQSSCSIVQTGEYYLAYCFAQVHNNTD